MRTHGSGTNRAGRRVARRLGPIGVALLATLAARGAGAQTARLEVLADTIEAGRPLDVAVTVTHAPGAQVAFPSVPQSGGERLRLGDAEVLALDRFPPAVRGDVRVDSVVASVLVFEADSAHIGPMAVRITSPTDTTVVRTGSARVPVRSVLAGEAPPYEPAPVGAGDPFPSATPLWAGLGALGLLVLGGGVWGIVRMLRRPGTDAAPLPYPTARAHLDALDREAPPADAPPEAVEAHVVATRDVLRGYLADRLGVPAREATTGELAAALDRDARVSDGAADAVRRALTPSDLVAFARVRPAPHAVARLREAARAAVEAVEADARRAEAPPEPPSA